MIMEIPALLCDATTTSAALAIVSGGIAVGVVLIDIAFDRVKETGRRKE